MKIESPLEVLSRAASIVQNEEDLIEKRVMKEDDSSMKVEHSSPLISPHQSERIDRERRSPKRHQPTVHKPLKKLRLTENETKFDRISRSETTATTYSLTRPPIVVSSYPQVKTSESAPPPLIAINETRKIRNLPDYDALFPRPSVISSSSPSSSPTTFMDYRYQTRCASDCKCKLSTSRFSNFTKKSTISSVITRDFELPTVDDHFRKSLGDKYDFKTIHERPSSVDDHFAKALGKQWYTINYGKCATS